MSRSQMNGMVKAQPFSAPDRCSAAAPHRQVRNSLNANDVVN
jgi:hypothetical protein